MFWILHSWYNILKKQLVKKNLDQFIMKRRFKIYNRHFPLLSYGILLSQRIFYFYILWKLSDKTKRHSSTGHSQETLSESCFQIFISTVKYRKVKNIEKTLSYLYIYNRDQTIFQILFYFILNCLMVKQFLMHCYFI